MNNRVENYDKEGNTPYIMNPSEYKGFFSLFWNFQHLLEFEIILLPIPCHHPSHPPFKFQFLGISET